MKHILVVNGHDDSRNLLKTALVHEGFKVTDESDSESAIRAVEEKQPDLVILELYLHPLDGQEFMTRLKTQPSTKHLPLVCLTSRVMETDRQAAMRAGADMFLPKPLTPTEVVTRVRELLEAASAG